MSESFTLLGILTKIEPAYAFAATEQGNVFIPLKAAQTNRELLFSLQDKYFQNEEVRLTVVAQNNKRNGCPWLAQNMRKSENRPSSSQLSQEIHGPMIATICATYDSYAFATTTMGTVFIPGDAFDSEYVKGVSRYVDVGDQLIVKFKEQIERTGCKWCAVEAVKGFVVEEAEMLRAAAADKNMIVGVGMVLEVDPMEVLIFDEVNTISVTCSLLTYSGGTQGNRSAKTLTDVINANDTIMFKAEEISGLQYAAVNWKKIVDTTDLEIPKRINKADSFVQTPNDVVTMMFKRFLIENPAELERLQPIIHKFPDASLPESYIYARDAAKSREAAEMRAAERRMEEESARIASDRNRKRMAANKKKT